MLVYRLEWLCRTSEFEHTTKARYTHIMAMTTHRLNTHRPKISILEIVGRGVQAGSSAWVTVRGDRRCRHCPRFVPAESGSNAAHV